MKISLCEDLTFSSVQSEALLEELSFKNVYSKNLGFAAGEANCI